MDHGLVLEAGLPEERHGNGQGYSQTTAPRDRSVSRAVFLSRLDADPDLAGFWAAGLAHGLQGARTTAAIHSMRTVEERLAAWLASGRPLPPKVQWQSLAEALGATREALYRELSKRRFAG